MGRALLQPLGTQLGAKVLETGGRDGCGGVCMCVGGGAGSGGGKGEKPIPFPLYTLLFVLFLINGIIFVILKLNFKKGNIISYFKILNFCS